MVRRIIAELHMGDVVCYLLNIRRMGDWYCCLEPFLLIPLTERAPWKLTLEQCVQTIYKPYLLSSRSTYHTNMNKLHN